MTLRNRLAKMSPIEFIIFLIITLAILYRLTIFLSKAFAYLGYNSFFWMDNLLKFESANPLVMWGIFGLFIGSIIGVIVAVKKYKLPKKLIIYPLGITLLLMIVLSFINKPTDVSGSFNIPTQSEMVTPPPPPQNTPRLYTVTQEMNVRSKPSLSSQKLFVLTKGSQVMIVENFLDWSKIQYTNSQTGSNQSGYIKSKYLKSSN